jgi:hypothetical protein
VANACEPRLWGSVSSRKDKGGRAYDGSEEFEKSDILDPCELRKFKCDGEVWLTMTSRAMSALLKGKKGEREDRHT